MNMNAQAVVLILNDVNGCLMIRFKSARNAMVRYDVFSIRLALSSKDQVFMSPTIAGPRLDPVEQGRRRTTQGRIQTNHQAMAKTTRPSLQPPSLQKRRKLPQRSRGAGQGDRASSQPSSRCTCYAGYWQKMS